MLQHPPLYSRSRMHIVWIGTLVALSFVSAQVDDALLCTANPAADSQPLDVNVDNIGGTRIGLVTSNCKRHFLGPQELHWHVYSIDNDAEPRIYTSPPQLVQAEVTRDGFLQFVLQDQAAFNYTIGDTIDGAGVILWLRASDMAFLEIVGVDTTAAITHTAASELDDSAMFVTANGVNVKVRLTARGPAIRFISQSVDLTAHLELFGDSSSSATEIDLRDVAARVSVSSKNTPAIQASMSGVDTELELLHGGGYESIVLSGVKGRVVVGTDCTGVEEKGLKTQCIVDANYTTERVPEVSCLVSNTTIVNVQSCFGVAISRGRILLGVGLAILLVIALVVACRRESHLPVTTQPAQAQPSYNAENTGDALPPMAMAEVIADGEPIDPHLVTAKVDGDDDTKQASS